MKDCGGQPWYIGIYGVVFYNLFFPPISGTHLISHASQTKLIHDLIEKL